MAVAGGSYGGFLALAALANYGDRLIGGVDLAGIADFISFLQTNTAPYRQSLRRAEYGDERDPRCAPTCAEFPARNQPVLIGLALEVLAEVGMGDGDQRLGALGDRLSL